MPWLSVVIGVGFGCQELSPCLHSKCLIQLRPRRVFPRLRSWLLPRSILPRSASAFYGFWNGGAGHRSGCHKRNPFPVPRGISDRLPTPRRGRSFPAQRSWNCKKCSRQRRHVQRDLPLRTPQRGSGKSEQSQLRASGAGRWDDASLRQPPPAAPAKDGFGRFIVSAPCYVDPL